MTVESPSRLLLTGADGFFGRHIYDRAIRAGYQVWRLGRHVQDEDGIRADLTQPGGWQEIVHDLRPDVVIHLAGSARGNDAILLRNIHVEGTKNLLTALDGLETWFALASSGAIYGEAVPGCLPWSEACKCTPLGAYAESKQAQEEVVLGAKSKGLRACIFRISNLLGPGQSEDFFVGRLVNNIARLACLDASPVRSLETGSLSATRDFIDVRDASDALISLVKIRAEGLFNLASGQESLLRDVAETCIALSGYSIRLNENPENHASPVTRQVLDVSALLARTDWRRSYALKDTLADMVKAALQECR